MQKHFEKSETSNKKQKTLRKTKMKPKKKNIEQPKI